MKDILRLGRYLRPYKGRILMAVAASFVSTIFLGCFWYLAPAIIRDTLSPPPGLTLAPRRAGRCSRADAPAGVGAPAGRSAGSRQAAAPRIRGTSASSRARPGSRACVASAARTSRSSLGFNAFNAWLREVPFTRLPRHRPPLPAQGIFNYFSEYWLKWVGFRTIQDLRLDLFERVLGQSARFYSKYPTGVLMSAVMGTSGGSRRSPRRTSPTPCAVVHGAFAVVIVFVISWRLSLVCLIGMPLVLIPLVRFGRKLKSASRSSQEKAAEVSNVLNESISGNRIVKAFGWRPSSWRASRRRWCACSARTRGACGSWRSPDPSSSSSAPCSARRSSGTRGSTSPRGPRRAGFFFFLLVMGYLFVILKALSSMNNDLQQAVPRPARVFEMMDMENEIVEAAGAVELRPSRRSALRRRALRLRRPDRAGRDRSGRQARARSTRSSDRRGRARPRSST
jgi:ABC-type multidrug transport system fused ATPase/permease subunit